MAYLQLSTRRTQSIPQRMMDAPKFSEYSLGPSHVTDISTRPHQALQLLLHDLRQCGRMRPSMSTAPEWVTSLIDQYAEASQQASNVQARSAEQLAVYESRLDRTLARLQERVREQEAVLTKVRYRFRRA